MRESERSRVSISRRQMLALSSAAGVGTVAGCLDGGGTAAYEDDLEAYTPSPAVNPFDGEYVFNPWHPNYDFGDSQEQVNEYLTVYHTEREEFVPRVAEEWTVDENNHTTLEISDEYAWSDGTDLTVQDLVTQLKIEIYLEQPVSEYIAPDGFEIVDDYTVEIEPRPEYEDLEESLWLNQWIEFIFQTPHEIWGDFVDDFEAAEGDEDEMESVRQDVADFAPEWDETVFSGPFVYEEANEQFAHQIPNPHHPIAQDFEIYFEHGISEEEEGLRSGDVDHHHQNPTFADLPDKYEAAPAAFSGQSFAILFGPEDEYVAEDHRVRQAIAHAIDFETVRDAQTPETPLDQYSTGIDAGYVEAFVDDDVLSEMNDYTGANTDRAAELLEDAGFEHEDGQWMTPDGEEWELNFPVSNWYEDASDVVQSNLNEFGIAVDWFVDEQGTWEAEHLDDNSYDMSANLAYGIARQYHAHADFQDVFFGPDWGAVEIGLLDEEVEVPEVGDPEGDTVTIDIRETWEEMAVADSHEEVVEHATELAWVHNQLLPAAVIHPWSEHYWVNAEEWNFDLDSDAWFTSNRIYHYILEEGLEPQ